MLDGRAALLAVSDGLILGRCRIVPIGNIGFAEKQKGTDGLGYRADLLGLKGCSYDCHFVADRRFCSRFIGNFSGYAKTGQFTDQISN
jgi:hypothetical protein